MVRFCKAPFDEFGLNSHRILMTITLYKTNDNSDTLYNSELDETYHSRNGAVEESLYVFLKQGFELASTQKQKIKVLEIGFGTGLNTILTAQKAAEMNAMCEYVALETNPLDIGLIERLNYHQFLKPEFVPIFKRMHQCGWDTWQNINPYFNLYKANTGVHQFKHNQLFDVVYFDAFGPDKQPEMWTANVFANVYKHLNSGGIFVTYSAKGEVKRTLKNIGFDVARLPGPPRKRHMLRAIKP
jgi:tRNA U34 5-methylaminomethyl-2-thiouridine-forming methyltransferase MnmC